MNPDTEGIHRVVNTDRKDRVADIVFVHGLGGGSHSTWKNGATGFFWPDELGKELPECGVWSAGYEAGMVPWFGADGLPIEDRAVNLGHKLTTGNLGDRPIVFITHSMGGLMVKEIIVQSLTAGDAALSAFVSRIAGIVFCGTPHRGSDAALMARRLGAILRTQPHIRDMAAGERHLDRMHSRFVEWHRKAQPLTEAYTEGLGMKRRLWWLRWLPRLMIVPPGSADPQLAGCRCIPCHDDHVDLVKPASREHDVYAGVLRIVRSALASVPRPALSGPPNGESPSPSDPAVIRSLIIDILREEGLLPPRR
jgi:pimeloyl-ACP methyl ester carboxylesterase